VIDPDALRAGRRARLRAAMREAGHEALVLTAAGSIRYATGAVPLHGDSSVEAAWPFAAIITAERTILLGVERDRVPADVETGALPRDPVRAAAVLADCVASARRVGVERLPFATAAALERALPGATVEPAERSVMAARVVKMADEIRLLRDAIRRTEAAVADVLPAVVPGVREIDLAGRFLAASARRGMAVCHVEPIWCAIPRHAADAPWTFRGGPPYRELTGERPLAPGDQVMIDTGMLHAGYLADVGWTWPCGGVPSAHDRTLRARWDEIVGTVLAECRPGVTAATLHRAALRAHGGGAPWPTPLYLAHGVGLGGVEPPFIGTDLGLAAEERVLLAEGMVLVLEPYVWEEGRGGYRAELTIAITPTGYDRLSAPPP